MFKNQCKVVKKINILTSSSRGVFNLGVTVHMAIPGIVL